MSLRHWEATRDAIRAKLADELFSSDLTSEQLDKLARTLTNTALTTYVNSIYGTEIEA